MEMTIIEEKENPFLKRKEIKVRLKHHESPTPPKADLVKELASHYAVEESQVVIDYVFSIKGIGESLAKVKILLEKPEVKNEAQTSETK